jgi:signal transduction histidine kinase
MYQHVLKKSREFSIDDNADGTGLGYIIIYELADLLHATIELKSFNSEGTSVTILL